MNFCAIICEFNPFHNGHAHIIQEAKRLTGLPVICLMSGNFVQRAEPACLNKQTRADIAVKEGADIVFELPTIFACGSAETFAKGAMHILKALPVTHLCFGAEESDIDKLKAAAALTHCLDNSELVKKQLKRGLNYKSAIQEAAKEIDQSIAEILTKPNNTLAIEYLKALDATNISPVIIKREDNYLSSSLNKFCSSTALRQAAKENNLEKFINFAPEQVLLELEQNAKDTTNIDEHLFFALQTASTEELGLCPSISEGLEHRISKYALQSRNFNEFLEKTVTKRYNRIRIRRVALENFFGIKRETLNRALTEPPTVNLLDRKPEIHFNGFFNDQIHLLLKKSDRKKMAGSTTFLIDLLADKLYSR